MALEQNLTVKAEQKNQVNPPGPYTIQRACACGRHSGGGGECAECRKKQLGLQRQAVSEAGSCIAPPIVQEALHSPGQPLDPATRTFMEARFDYDLSKVRVHTDSTAAESARAVNALAYTAGCDIVFGTGQYAPHTNMGGRLVAHELTHVVQQGSRNPTLQDKLTVNEVNDGFEREADAVATAIMDSRALKHVDVHKQVSVAPIQRWSYGAGNHATSGGNLLTEVTAAERRGNNGVDNTMAIVDRLVAGANWRARNCQEWFTDNCIDPRTLADLHSRAVIWMWRIADGSTGLGLTDGGSGPNHAVTEQLFNSRDRWAMAATILHEYWHDCDTGAPADIGDDAKAACGLPNI